MINRKFDLDPMVVKNFSKGKQKKLILKVAHIPGERDIFLTKEKVKEIVEKNNFSVIIRNSI